MLKPESTIKKPVRDTLHPTEPQMMESLIRDLVKLLSHSRLEEFGVIPWAAPVPSFGAFNSSRIATVGINPSNLEFQDFKGKELQGCQRRLYSLSYFGITDWNEATSENIQQIARSCEDYFLRNPYRKWFDQLEFIFSPSGLSYYWPNSKVCHLDLVPFATHRKWSALKKREKCYLKKCSKQFLKSMLVHSDIDFIILNGNQVVVEYQDLMDHKLEAYKNPDWNLKRKNGSFIPGIAYYGKKTILHAGKQRKSIFVVGFNHNLQSSFGVSSNIKESIRMWILERWTDATNERY